MAQECVLTESSSARTTTSRPAWYVVTTSDTPSDLSSSVKDVECTLRSGEKAELPSGVVESLMCQPGEGSADAGNCPVEFPGQLRLKQPLRR